MNDLGVLILVGLFMLAKWLVQKAGNPSDDEENNAPGAGRTESPVPRRSQPLPNAPESEEERMRRFMEALGLPAGSTPPQRPRRPVVPPPLSTAKTNETISQQRPKPKRMQLPQRPPPDRRPIAPPSEPIAPPAPIPQAASMREAAPQMEVASIPEIAFATPESYIRQARPLATEQPAAQRVTSGGVPLRLQLRDRDALRKALIMREILGAPKALQSAESPSIFSPL